MARYRYIPWDRVTGQRLDELPLTNVTYEVGLNRTCAASASLPLKSSDELNALYVSATDPRRYLIVVERGGLPQGAYIPWQRTYRRSTRTLSLSMSDLSAWALRADPAPAVTYTNTDLYDIVRDQVNTNLNPKIGALITVNPASADRGATADLVIENDELKPVWEIITDLAERSDGYDWWWSYAWDSAGGLDVTLNLAAVAGRSAAATGLVIEQARNVIDYEWVEDAGESADRVTATGLGMGSVTRRAVRADTSLPSAGYYPLHRVVSRKDTKVQASLDVLADAEIAQRAQPGVAAVNVTINGDTDPMPGAWIPGDEMTFVARRGEDPRFPAGVSHPLRIMTWSVAVSATHNERVELHTSEVNNGAVA